MRASLTVDLEEWFHVCGFAGESGFLDGVALRSTVEADTERLLAWLSSFGVRATFFCVGEIAAARPALVRQIAAQGHEIAAHGWRHVEAFRLDKTTFRNEVVRARATLEDLVRAPVVGFRAPSWSIRRANTWAWGLLAESGYRYDASPLRVLFPGQDPSRLGPDGFRIFPIVHLAMPFVPLPVGAGIFLRVVPPRVVAAAFRATLRRGEPAVLGVHPWELDPEPPRAPMRVWHRFLHYTGLRGVRARLEPLLRGHAAAFRPLAELLDPLPSSAHAPSRTTAPALAGLPRRS